MYFYILNSKQNETKQNELLEMRSHVSFHSWNGKRIHLNKTSQNKPKVVHRNMYNLF